MSSAPSHCQRREVKRTGRPRGPAAILLVHPAVALLLLTATSTVRAHPQYSPTRSNRYLKLTPSGDGAVRLSWSLLVGETPALAVRRAADANGDGLVNEQELGGFAGRLLDEVKRSLAVELDGARAQVAWEPPVVGLSDARVGPLPFSVDLIGRLAVPAGAPEGGHRVRVDDDTAIDELGESEIRVEEGPGARVLAGWQGREDGGRQLRFVWNGPKASGLEDRSVGFRFTDGRSRRRFRFPMGLLAALVGGAVAWAAARRARRGGATGG